VAGAGQLGCRVSGLLWCDMPWQTLEWSFGGKDPVKLIDLRLELTEGRSHGLGEEAEQGLMETLVLAVRGRLVGLCGDRLDTGPGDVINELAHEVSPAATCDARDSVAFDGAGDPIAIIFACTLSVPQSRPDCSNAARTSSACLFTSSLTGVGDVRGRRDFGSSTAVVPSATARARRSRTSSERCRARRRRSSPCFGEHPAATARSQDGHEGQRRQKTNRQSVRIHRHR